MVVLYQSFHKALYFQLILFCAFLLHPEDDSVLCLKSYHEAPKESHNTSTTYLYSKHGRDNVESTGKQSGTAHQHHIISVWITILRMHDINEYFDSLAISEFYAKYLSREKY